MTPRINSSMLPTDITPSDKPRVWGVTSTPRLPRKLAMALARIWLSARLRPVATLSGLSAICPTMMPAAAPSAAMQAPASSFSSCKSRAMILRATTSARSMASCDSMPGMPYSLLGCARRSALSSHLRRVGVGLQPVGPGVGLPRGAHVRRHQQTELPAGSAADPQELLSLRAAPAKAAGHGHLRAQQGAYRGVWVLVHHHRPQSLHHGVPAHQLHGHAPQLQVRMLQGLLRSWRHVGHSARQRIRARGPLLQPLAGWQREPAGGSAHAAPAVDVAAVGPHRGRTHVAVSVAVAVAVHPRRLAAADLQLGAYPAGVRLAQPVDRLEELHRMERQRVWHPLPRHAAGDVLRLGEQTCAI